MPKPRRERLWWIEVSHPEQGTFRIEVDRDDVTDGHRTVAARVRALMVSFVTRKEASDGE